jgi:predicted MPP superfamily phosphohydrolase
MSTMRRRWTIAIVVLVVVAPTIWALIEPALLRREAYELSVPSWPAEQAGLRIALLSDLHVGSPWNGLDKLRRIVEETNAARPDLVLLAGDFVITAIPGGRFVAPEAIAEVLRGLQAPLGVHAVLGNHDWWLNPKVVEQALSRVGIDVLEDRATKITSGPWRFWLVGLGDLWEGHHDVAAAMAQVADGDPVLLFMHNPDLFPEIPQRVSLTMAGHSHGGQVYLPLFGHPHNPALRHQQYAVGHVVEQGRHLFVTPGLGTSVLPIRFFMPPEISVLTIQSGAPSSAGPAP